jgi:hypothetical protein
MRELHQSFKSPPDNGAPKPGTFKKKFFLDKSKAPSDNGSIARGEAHRATAVTILEGTDPCEGRMGLRSRTLKPFLKGG